MSLAVVYILTIFFIDGSMSSSDITERECKEMSTQVNSMPNRLYARCNKVIIRNIFDDAEVERYVVDPVSKTGKWIKE